VTRVTVFRILDSHRRVNAAMWAARAPIIAAQLRVMRGTYPETGAAA
jgi:hypothetical protein